MVLFFWDTLIIVHSCKGIPFCCFYWCGILQLKGLVPCFLMFFSPMRLVSLGNIGLAVGAGGSVKITPFSPVLQTAMDDAMFTFRTLLNCSSPQCLRLRGATQTECCNISYHGNNLFRGGVGFPYEVFGLGVESTWGGWPVEVWFTLKAATSVFIIETSICHIHWSASWTNAYNIVLAKQC